MSTSNSTNTTGIQQQQILQISTKAQAKILRHAIQYSEGPIHGILIGQFHYPKNNNAGPMLEVQDCVPICHSSPTKPLLDMAFRLVQTHIDNEPGSLEIVGW